MARIERGYTVKQDGKGNAVIVKKPFGRQSTSAQIAMRKSKKVRPQKPQIGFGYGKKP